MLVLTCPKCEDQVTAADDKRGEIVVCEACGQRIRAANPVSPRVDAHTQFEKTASPDSATLLDPAFANALQQARNELLDLSLRNRALSLRPQSKSAKVLQIVNECSALVYERLVEKSRSFAFSPDSRGTGEALAQPDDPDEDDAAALEKARTDGYLQTTLTSEALAKRLTAMERDARTAIEEQGSNQLFLSLGQLVWYEDNTSDIALHAPLLFVPVQIIRDRRATEMQRFRLAVIEGEEIFGNVSLIARLRQSFSIDLSAPDTEAEAFAITDYFQTVADRVKGQARWRVLPDAMALGFFSFQKYLMFLDLKHDRWPEEKALEKHPVFAGVLMEGLPATEPPFADDIPIDDLVAPEHLDHVVDADSSQTLAIEKVRRGMNLVIQGPPGTGKSQTITNLIATAVLDGKRVLFVAEKMAALDVVKRRLEHEGLDAICLELHGAGQNSVRMLTSVMNAWELGPPVMPGEAQAVPDFTRKRDILNALPQALHTPLSPSGLSPFQIIGQLCLLQDEGVEVPLEGVEAWKPEDRERRLQEAVGFREALDLVGPPGKSLWRGVSADGVLSIDLEPMARTVIAVLTALTSLRESAATLAASISQRPADSLDYLADQIVVGQNLAAAPEAIDRAAISDPVWETGRADLAEGVGCGRRLSDAMAAAADKVAPAAFERDWQGERASLGARAGSTLRFFSVSYRHARRELAGVLTGYRPRNDADRLALLDALLTARSTRETLARHQETGQRAFGTLWRGERTDWGAARAVLDWAEASVRAGLGHDFRALAGVVKETRAITGAIERVVAARDALLSAARIVAERLVLDWAVAFARPLEETPFPVVEERMQGWIEHRQTLPDWSRFLRSSRKLAELGMGALADEAVSGRLDPSLVEPSFQKSLYTALIRQALRTHPVLADFKEAAHNRTVTEFRVSDKQRLDLARHRVLTAHHAGLPKSGERIGDIGFIRGEAERKRNRRSIRTILRRAGGLVQSIKPVFLMSPLSVAQYLEPGAVEFDLLVIDEASQVKPVDALGAIARSRQIVVVGDSKQLPPTSFFERLSSGDEEDNDPDVESIVAARPAESRTAPAQAMESVLSLCVARGAPETCLRWHYRSRHHSLIAVSNREFYENRLFIIPSPFQTGHGGLGVRFHLVAGCYDRSRSRTNREEAREVVKAIRNHAAEHTRYSLGVATFSTAQRDAILDELELAMRDDPNLEAFVSRADHEPFFIKNLESVQGDERDVIFISVGYGRDASGHMVSNFGPVNGVHGARRLNVLFSRAKFRCEVFASITDEEIETRGENVSQGVRALKNYLRFARTGQLEMPCASGREMDSPFETSVLRAIEAMGYTADTQVGQSGFFIDLAVLDPRRPGRYLLGVECDGATYHSSRFARERDRLRQSVLESQGWRIHRIWSTDWFKQPEQAKERVRQRIEELLAEADHDVIDLSAAEASEKAAMPTQIDIQETLSTLSLFVPHVALSARPAVVRAAPRDVEESGIGALATPYKQASGSVTSNAGNLATFKAVILKVLACEAPIHRDELDHRCRDFFNLTRVNTAFAQQMRGAMRELERAGGILRAGEFLTLPGRPANPRNRSEVTSTALRKPTMIAPEEYDAAVRMLIRHCHGACSDDVAVGVSRLLGFKATSPQIRDHIMKSLTRLVRDGEVKADADAVGIMRLVTENGVTRDDIF